MKGRGQLVMGGLAGLLIGVGVGGVVGFNKGHDTGYSEGQSRAEDTRLTYGSSRYAEGRASGLEEGVNKGKEEQYNLMKNRTNGPLFMRDSESGSLIYGRFDILFDGTPYASWQKGRSAPSDIIIISDLRGVTEPKEDLAKLNGKAYNDLLWRGKVPFVVMTSPEGEKRWQEDEDIQRLVERYLPPFSYKIKVIPTDKFQTVDPWEHIKDDRTEPFTPGEYTPAKIEFPEEKK